MKKITILALHLGYGGIEKAICSLANMLCNNYQVNIVSTYKLYDEPAFDLDEKVSVSYLMNEKPNKKEIITCLKKFKLISLVKQILIAINILLQRKYRMIETIKKIDSDIIISTRVMHNRWLGIYGCKKALKIAWEHVHHNNNGRYINKLVTSCEKMDYLVCVSKELADFYTKVISKKVNCIYIPLALDNIPTEKSALNNKQIISIGRLSKEKSFLDLIDVFKLVNIKKPDWQLHIVGDGLEKEKIEHKIKINKLNSNIIMHGYQNKTTINELLLDSSIYVMTSYTESFGLVLIEAMSYGLPCLCFDSAKGALSIIDNNVNGFVIENRNKITMANKIIELIDNEQLRQSMGRKAKEKAITFSIDNIKNKWLKVLNDN
ncbi:MAG: glycosyltransferase [Bacilli bacterium]|jgi:glycosyltransferase involved in cell wall biosynthesis